MLYICNIIETFSKNEILIIKKMVKNNNISHNWSLTISKSITPCAFNLEQADYGRRSDWGSSPKKLT
jgi:hypothetical protein